MRRLVTEWHARLAPGGEGFLVDLQAGGAGPGEGREGPLHVVLDGVLFDVPSLAAHADVAPDAEPARIVARLFSRTREGALERMRGRFTVVAFDADRGELVAARDALGIRPLFHTRARDGATLVSPYLDVLLRQPGVDRTVDELALAGQWIAGLDAAPEETPFTAIRRVPPGHLLRAGDGSAEVRRYWAPTPASCEPLAVGGRFEELLEQALERARGAGRFGVYLSGGLDSATVATAASRVGRRAGSPPPVALAVLNPTPEADEEATQRAVASALGLTLEAASPYDVLTPGAALLSAIRLAASSAWPPGPLQPLGDDLAQRAVGLGCDALLSGDGGDEWLAPFPTSVMESIGRLDPKAVLAIVRSWNYTHPGMSRRMTVRNAGWSVGARPFVSAVAVGVLERTAPGWLRRRRIDQLSAQWPPWFLPDATRRADLVDWWLERRLLARPARMHEAQKRNLLTRSATSLMFEYNLATGRRAGAEMLAPFWDVDLIEFALGLPTSTLVAGGRAKALPRDYIARDIEFADRWPGKTFGDSVFGHLIEREAAGIWAETGGAPALREMGLVDEGRLASALARPRSDLNVETRTIWDVLALEAWIKARIVSPHEAPQA